MYGECKVRSIFIGLVFLILNLTGCIGAGMNSDITLHSENVFPEVIGVDLLGNERKLPQSFSSKCNIAVIAFEREQQKDVDTWISYFDTQIAPWTTDVSFFEIPTIYELPAAYRFWINNGMRSGVVDEKARKRTITLYLDRERFINHLGLSLDSIYLLIIDSRGVIQHSIKGPAQYNEDRVLPMIKSCLDAKISK